MPLFFKQSRYSNTESISIYIYQPSFSIGILVLFAKSFGEIFSAIKKYLPYNLYVLIVLICNSCYFLVAYPDPWSNIYILDNYGNTIRTLKVSDTKASTPLDSLETLPGGILISISKRKHNLLMWNTTDYSLLKTISTSLPNINKLALIDEYTLACSSQDGFIQIWNLTSGLLLQNVFDMGNLNEFQLLPNRLIATADSHWMVKIWNLTNGIIYRSLTGHAAQIFCLELIDQTILASGSMDKSIILWDLTIWKIKLIYYNAHTDGVSCLKLISSGILASGSLDGTIKIWNTETYGSLINKMTHTSRSRVAYLDVFSEDILVSVCVDHSIKMWQISTGLLLKTLATSTVVYTLKRLDIECKFYLKKYFLKMSQ